MIWSISPFATPTGIVGGSGGGGTEGAQPTRTTASPMAKIPRQGCLEVETARSAGGSDGDVGE
jgi:hypothetical protein